MNLKMLESQEETKSSYFVCSTRLQCGIIGWRCGYAADAVAMPVLVRAGICNFFMVLVIARQLFAKDTVGSWTSINKYWQRRRSFNVHPRDGTHIDESPCLWNTWMTVYSWVGIQTQARHWCECVYLKSQGHAANPRQVKCIKNWEWWQLLQSNLFHLLLRTFLSTKFVDYRWWPD